MVKFTKREKQVLTGLLQEKKNYEITVALLMACLTKANIDFDLDFDGIIGELNEKNNDERDS